MKAGLSVSRQADGGEYAAALHSVHVEPVVLRCEPDAVDEQLDGVDALVVTGGGDVDPACYGSAPSALAAGIDAVRDRFEIALLRRARDRGMPTLCICRGMQIANVAFGGTLILDLPRTPLDHTPRRPDGTKERGIVPAHRVELAPHSLLAQIAGSHALATNSRHHQAVDRVADDLVVTARAVDGCIEAVEARFASPFWLGVQWHPESTLDDRASVKIFAAFARSEERRSAERSAQPP